ncbi:F0F1 ATP synthase subunit A [Albidovulum sediminicola]|uniref:F0F1 ATP synthase subunit A n=1 Tax=Albidovulum sediminicola TaxID=2984331 RepID=A0ABT2Z1Q0_9RHOB|nr:F0F1 ATP synthase subunit A [Defluviimonas sp. WL0075]MCV2865073.1 F0F1 ATP synthase subunit A [Defluviimonas sp. WL0075]
MLPINIVSEISRAIALAVRLNGRFMSGTVIAGTDSSIAPFFFPLMIQVLGLRTGLIQAYIFAALAMGFIASTVRPDNGPAPSPKLSNGMEP